MSTTKAPDDAVVPARPDRAALTHPEAGAPAVEPFAEKVRAILQALGEDPGREGLLKTPERVESSLRWLTQGYRLSVADAVGDAVLLGETTGVD